MPKDVLEDVIFLEKPKSTWQLIKTLFVIEERNLLKICNTDGYFFLLFLKLSSKLFAIMSLVGLFLIMPVYYREVNNQDVQNVLNDNSLFLELTLATSINRSTVLWFVMTCTLLFTLLAYYSLYQICTQMGNFVF